MIKAILFDLDQTLIDFMKLKRMCIEASISAMVDAGLNINKESAEKELFELYNEYGIEYEHIFQKFLEKAIGDVDYKILAKAIVAYRKVRASFLEPYPNVQSTLLKLRERGYKLAIVSDAPRLKAWIRLASMRLDDFFDVVISFDDTGKTKPDCLPFQKALEQLNVAPSETLMIGDNLSRDILGAKKLGIKTCFAKYGFTIGFKERIKADYEIKRFEELLNILK